MSERAGAPSAARQVGLFTAALLPGALVWLYRRNHAIYRSLRDTILATWLLAVPVYAAFPVAPPRLVGLGMVDTVSHQAAVALTGHTTVFYNPYAAVPSLHCGFAFAIGLALGAAARRRLTRVLALLWGPLVTLTVIATANHYVLDVAAGLLAAATGYLISRLVRRIAPVRVAMSAHAGLPWPAQSCSESAR